MHNVLTIFFSFLHFVWPILSGFTAKKYEITHSDAWKAKHNAKDILSFFPLFLKDPGMKAEKECENLANVTQTHTNNHIHIQWN